MTSDPISTKKQEDKNVKEKHSGNFSFLKKKISTPKIFDNLFLAAPRINYLYILIVLTGIAAGVAIRVSLWNFRSLDYYASLQPWYNFIRHQGFKAFGANFSTYNPPYLYLLYIIARFFPDVPTVIAVKIPSLIADFFIAYFVYLLVRIKYIDGWHATIAALVAFLAPTVILNSAFWGQADSLFTLGMIASIFLLMKKKSFLSMLAYGIALAFKLQAIFLAPLLFAFWLRGIIRFRDLLVIPTVLILALVPSWLAGRPILDLLNVYLFQASQFEQLTMNAPSIYAWLPEPKMVFLELYMPGVIFGAIVAFMLFVMVYKSTAKLTQPLILELCLVAVMAVPFFLPKMHDRYFYPADVLSIVYAFFFPEMYFVPILMSGVSFFAYQPFLFNTAPIPLQFLSAVLLFLISVVVYRAVRSLYSARAAADNYDGPQGSAEIIHEIH
jgi:Gpi18-like mannosyltransferase